MFLVVERVSIGCFLSSSCCLYANKAMWCRVYDTFLLNNMVKLTIKAFSSSFVNALLSIYNAILLEMLCFVSLQLFLMSQYFTNRTRHFSNCFLIISTTCTALSGKLWSLISSLAWYHPTIFKSFFWAYISV